MLQIITKILKLNNNVQSCFGLSEITFVQLNTNYKWLKLTLTPMHALITLKFLKFKLGIIICRNPINVIQMAQAQFSVFSLLQVLAI